MLLAKGVPPARQLSLLTFENACSCGEVGCPASGATLMEWITRGVIHLKMREQLIVHDSVLGQSHICPFVQRDDSLNTNIGNGSVSHSFNTVIPSLSSFYRSRQQ